MRFPKATDMAHRLVGERLKKRDVVIDATAGNGHDTLFLATAVGSGGLVYALDVQPAALAETKRRLEEAGARKQVRLRETGHENLREVVAAKHHGKVAVAMFNLGYLPGGDKSKTTRWETTLVALRAAMELLAANGVLTVVCYPGHPAGAEEANAVSRWVATLEPSGYRVARYGFENAAGKPPFLIAVEKV